MTDFPQLEEPISDTLVDKRREIEETDEKIDGLLALRALADANPQMTITRVGPGDDGGDALSDDTAGVRLEWAEKLEALYETKAIVERSVQFLEAIVALQTHGYSEERFHAAVAANMAHFSAQCRGMEGTLERTGYYRDGIEDSEETELMNDMLAAFVQSE